MAPSSIISKGSVMFDNFTVKAGAISSSHGNASVRSFPSSLKVACKWD